MTILPLSRRSRRMGLRVFSCVIAGNADLFELRLSTEPARCWDIRTWSTVPLRNTFRSLSSRFWYLFVSSW